MKYQCSEGHLFTHVAKLTENNIRAFQYSSMSPQPTSYPDNVLEFAICPICQSKTFTEYVEAVADIVSVKSVDLNEVDTYLKDGYVVEAMFAKTATIKKLAAKETPQQSEDKFTEDAKTYYTKLHEVKP